MRILTPLLLVTALLCFGTEDDRRAGSPAPASLSNARREALTFTKFTATAKWKGGVRAGYGYGNYTLKMSTPTEITDLTTLAGDQDDYLSFLLTGRELNVWADWITKDTATKRVYVYKGEGAGGKFKATITFKLKKGVLYITVKRVNNDDNADIFGLADTDSEEVITHDMLLVLKDSSDMVVVSSGCLLPCNAVNKKGKKSTIKKQ